MNQCLNRFDLAAVHPAAALPCICPPWDTSHSATSKCRRPCSRSAAPPRIASRLNELRKKADMSQYDLVNRLATYSISVRQSPISGIENGDSKPSLDMLVGLVYSLDTNADYLLGLTDDPRPVGLMAKTVAKVVNDDAQRAILREIVARITALPPDSRQIAHALPSPFSSHHLPGDRAAS